MLLEDLVKFLGFPAQREEFDRYLTAHSISYRPVSKETPVDLISVEEHGVSLIFNPDDLYEEIYGTPPDGGSMIFTTLQVFGEQNASGFKQYPASLPYNLTFKSTLDEATEIFGKPTVEHPSGKNHAYVWYNYKGGTIGITFLPADQGISFLTLTKVAKEPPEPLDWD